MKQQQLPESTLGNRSGSPVSPTEPWFFAELLAVGSGTKSQTLNYSRLMRRWSGTCNFEASFHRASTNFPLLGLSWGNTQIAGARSIDRKDTHRKIFNSPLFHYIGDPHTRSKRWIFWRNAVGRCHLPHSTVLAIPWLPSADPQPISHTRILQPPPICEQVVLSTCLQRSETALLVMLPQIATDSANIAMPESEKKFLWVKCGLITKSCTHSRALRTSSSQIITCSRLVVNLSLKLLARVQRELSAGTPGKNKMNYWRLKRSQAFTLLVTIHTLFRCWRAWKPACEEQNDKTSLT